MFTIDAVSKAVGIVLRLEGVLGGRKIPRQRGQIAKNLNVSWPVGNSGTVVTFSELNMT